MRLNDEAQRAFSVQDYAFQPPIQGVDIVDLKRFGDDGGSLTELGRSMSEPVLAFGEWVRAHLAEFDAARRRFDERGGKVERAAGL